MVLLARTRPRSLLPFRARVVYFASLVAGGPTQARALIYDVQRFSVHDGPGIRTTVFFKGCPLRCRWCQNPESLRVNPELWFDADRCQGTGACIPACPRFALAVGDRRLSRERCDGCGLCVPACAHSAFRRIGREVTVDEVLAEVRRDEPFFKASGGGVTLSGGEPTLQLDFVAAFAAACREVGLSVGLQTCGAFAWTAFAPHLPLFDFIHFDLKAIDAGRHRALTGSDNAAILSNARRLAQSGTEVEFRMPLVGGHNDAEDDLNQLAAFVLGLGRSRLQLLPYHPMGESKLARLASPLAPLSPPVEHSPERTAAAAAHLRAQGLEIRL